MSQTDPAADREAERRALATLTRLVEPADPLLTALLTRHHAVDVVAMIQDGASPAIDPELLADVAAGSAGEGARGGERPLDRRMRRWRARLSQMAPERDLALCERMGGRLVCPFDPEWPTQLDALGVARPYALWVRGSADLRFSCLRSVSVVGARAATPYGTHVAADLAVSLAEHGWTVVSGGAYGVDGAAHRGALAAGGTTVVVLACGLDVAYPRGHDELFREVEVRGVLMSEWPPGSTPTRPRFLIRNRVIAALTRGTVVVEAALRSGAISTARHARDLNRAVMVVPGPVTSKMSAGCHRLLRDWDAVCVTSAAEVIEQVGSIGDDLAPVQRGPVLARDALDATTLQILEAVPARGGAGPAAIAVAAGIDLATTLRCLGFLAAGGFVTRVAHGWRLCQDGTAGPAGAQG